MHLFLDLDGVLADFDTGYKDVFGYKSDKKLDNVDWEIVRKNPKFYENLPPMPDMEILWNFAAPHNPTILTGVPKEVAEASDNKKAWIRKYLGDVPVVCCLSKEKSLYSKPGDVLVDDWEKYKHIWIKGGGLWITHTSAVSSIEELKKLGFS